MVSNSRITGNPKNRSYSALRLNFQLLWDIHHLPPRIQWGSVCVCAYHRYKYRIHNSWLVVYLPLWKIWKSVGSMTFPIYGKIKKCFKPPTRYKYRIHNSIFVLSHCWTFAVVVNEESYQQWCECSSVRWSKRTPHPQQASEGFTNHEQRFVNVLFWVILGDFEHHLKKSLLEMH